MFRKTYTYQKNQAEKVRCGDNGIFKGVPLADEQKELSKIARGIYVQYPTDVKYILANNRLIICQSHAPKDELLMFYPTATIKSTWRLDWWS